MTSRRIGHRRSLAELPAWLLLESTRWPRRVRRVPITLDDVSITGLGFVMVEPIALRCGQVVTVEVNGARSRIRIRHVTHVDERTGALCGAVFTESSPEVVVELERVLVR